MKISNNTPTDVCLTEIGERIKRARIRMDMTQQTLANEAGVTNVTVSRLEAGKKVQSDTLIKVLRTLSLLDNLDLLIPSTDITPIEAMQIEHQKNKNRRQRASRKVIKSPSETIGGRYVTKTFDGKKGYTWGRDKK